MIEICRSLVRQFRSLLKKSVSQNVVRGTPIPVTFKSGADGLSIWATSADVTLRYHQPGRFDDEEFCIKAEDLTDIEGKKDDTVCLGKIGKSQVSAGWEDHRIPQNRRLDAYSEKNQPAPLVEPSRWSECPNGFGKALSLASDCTADNEARYALTCVQLDGRDGKIVATDGRHLLLQEGFTFPWKDRLLVPAVTVFDCKDWPTEENHRIGRNGDHVVIKAGNWTLWLRNNKEGRFPPFDSIIPKDNDLTHSIQLDDADANFVVQSLKQLPGSAEQDSPVTLELANRRVFIMARVGDEPCTELLLAHSASESSGLSYPTNRNYLKRALELGFREIRFSQAGSPAVCRNSSGALYLWMGLGKDAAVKVGSNPVQISSDLVGPVANTMPSPIQERLRSPMPRTFSSSFTPTNGNGNGTVEEANGHTSNGQHQSEAGNVGIQSLIAEAESLKTASKTVYLQAKQLTSKLRRHRRQAQIVQSTITSLRQLQAV